MLILHPLHPSGPDFLLVCGCKGTTFPDTIPENTPIQDKPNSLLLCHNQYFTLCILLLVLYH